MMDRKNRNDNEILNMGGSRFSGEERARMAQEISRERKRSRPSAAGKASPVNGSERKTAAVSSKNRGSANGKGTVQKKEGSRNDRVRTSTQQRKKEKKRQNNFFVAVLFLAVVAAIGIATVLLLKINTVEVVNSSDTYSDAGIIASSGIEAGDSMLLINPGAAAAAITTELPFIETAVIERQWPDKVVITVEYAETAMIIDSGTGYILLNRSCKVLDDDSPVFTEMAAQVKGVKVASAVPGQQLLLEGDIDVTSLKNLAQAAEENGIEKISCYDLTKITDVTLMVDRRIEVKLGTLASAPEKLGFCREVIKRTAGEDINHAMVIDFTADGTAYARVKKDNHVNYEEETVPEVTITDEPLTGQTASPGNEGAVEEETTASFSVG